MGPTSSPIALSAIANYCTPVACVKPLANRPIMNAVQCYESRRAARHTVGTTQNFAPLAWVLLKMFHRSSGRAFYLVAGEDTICGTHLTA